MRVGVAAVLALAPVRLQDDDRKVEQFVHHLGREIWTIGNIVHKKRNEASVQLMREYGMGRGEIVQVMS